MIITRGAFKKIISGRSVFCPKTLFPRDLRNAKDLNIQSLWYDILMYVDVFTLV